MYSSIVILLFSLTTVFPSTDTSIPLGSCSLSCNGNESHANELLGPRRVQGAQGKRGPIGPQGDRGVKGERGNQGLPGQACDCSRYDSLSAQIAAINAEMNEFRGILYAGTGWSKESNNLDYKFFSETVNYETAKSRCNAHGGRLAAAGLRIPAVRRKLKKLLSGDLVWIGLDDLASQGNYVWLDRVASTTTNTEWRPNEPSQSNERCCAMYKPADYQIADITCSAARGYLCEAGYD